MGTFSREPSGNDAALDWLGNLAFGGAAMGSAIKRQRSPFRSTGRMPPSLR